MAPSTLSKIEAGERNPSAEVLVALAPVYKVEPTYLMKLAGILPDATEATAPESIADEDPLELVDRALRKKGIDAERRRAVLTVVRSVLSERERV